MSASQDGPSDRPVVPARVPWWAAWWLPFASVPVAWIAALMILGPLDGPPRCRDGWASPSIGRPGACSWHGGVRRGGSWAGIGAIAAAAGSFYGIAKMQARFSPPVEPAPRPAAAPLAVPPPRVRGRRPVDGEVGCPKCGSAMVMRLARRGRNRGKPFWGCSGYPTCQGTRNV